MRANTELGVFSQKEGVFFPLQRVFEQRTLYRGEKTAIVKLFQIAIYMKQITLVFVLAILSSQAFAQKSSTRPQSFVTSDQAQSKQSTQANLEKKPKSAVGKGKKKSAAEEKNVAPAQVTININDSLLLQVVKDVLHLMRVLGTAKESPSGKQQPSKASKITVGTLRLKKETNIRLYTRGSVDPIESEAYKNAKTKGKAGAIDEKDRYEAIHIDSITINIKDGKIKQFVLFAEDDAFICPISISPDQLKTPNAYLDLRRRNKEPTDVHVFIDDIIVFAPAIIGGTFEDVDITLTPDDPQSELQSK